MIPSETRQTEPILQRWMCDRHEPPVLLGMIDDAGHLHIKVRNRDWYVTDFRSVTATCPKCGAIHTRESPAT